MESEERPAKIRKLSGDDHIPTEQAVEQTKSSRHAKNEEVEDPNLPSHREDQTEKSHNLKPVKAEEIETPSLASNQADQTNSAHNHTNESHENGEANEEGSLPAPEDTAPSLGVVSVDPQDPPLSKNQLKKLKRKADWESKRGERKIIRKEKLVAKRERKRAAKEQDESATPEASTEPPKPQVHRQPVTLPVTIIIDCDFDDLMRDNERNSLQTQITRSYSDNKNSLYRAHLTICSFGGQLRDRFDNLLRGMYKQWKGVRTFDCDFVETAELAKQWMSEPQGNKLAGVYSKYANLDEEAHKKLRDEGEVVYLTSEGDEDLMELKPYSTYIIGGLVDKNREKGICYKRATKRNVRTAKLPIGQYMDMQSRKVLTTNHVNEIMVKWLECGDWGEAFTKVIPKRKGGKLKGTEDAEEDQEQDEGQDHEEGENQQEIVTLGDN